MKITSINKLTKNDNLQDFLNPKSEIFSSAKKQLDQNRDILLVKLEGEYSYANLIKTEGFTDYSMQVISKYEDDSREFKEEKDNIEKVLKSVNSDLNKLDENNFLAFVRTVTSNSEVVTQGVLIEDEFVQNNFEKVYSNLLDAPMVIKGDEQEVITLGSFFDESIIHEEQEICLENVEFIIAGINKIVQEAKKVKKEQEQEIKSSIDEEKSNEIHLHIQ